MSKKMNPVLESLLPIRRWVNRMEEGGFGEEAWKKVRLWEEMIESEEVVRVEREGHVGLITLNVPRRGNAFVAPMYALFPAAARELSEDDNVRVVVVTGKGKNFSTGGYVGPDAFYAGEDAGQKGPTAKLSSDPEAMRRTFREMFQQMQLSLYKIQKPTIAALNGQAIQDAIDFVLAADMRIGHKNSDFRFMTGYTGNSSYCGAYWLLPRIVGIAKASELLFLAPKISGEEAYRIGLLNFLVPEEKFREEMMELANRLASMPPIGHRLVKIQLQRGLAMPDFDFALEMSAAMDPILQFTEDHLEAEAAIVEKRTPVVRGR